MSAEASQTAIAAFISSPAGQWLSVTGWLVGAIGTTVGVAAYLEQRRQSNAYAYILDDAKRRWRGEFAEAQVQQLETELERLKLAMTKGIPVEARKAVASSQMAALRTSIIGDWERYLALEHVAEAETVPLPKELRTAIESQLIPRERVRARQIKVLTGVGVAVLALLTLQTLLTAGGNPVRLVQYVMESLGMFAPANQLLSYLIGVVVVLLLSSDWFVPSINDFILRHTRESAGICAAAFLGWVVATYWLTTSYEYPVPIPWHSAFEVIFALFTLLLLWIGLRVGRALVGRQTV